MEDITQEHIDQAAAHMVSQEFKASFTQICQMDTIPEITLNLMKKVKSDFIERIISPETTEALGNAARLLSSWLDGVLEYTVLKHEVIVLRLKSNKVHCRIKELSAIWPRKKQFIEGAYKILLFTKTQRRQVVYTINALRERGLLTHVMDFKEAINRVLKKWYEQRIKEETERNQRLRILHDSLTRVKELRELQNSLQREFDLIEVEIERTIEESDFEKA